MTERQTQDPRLKVDKHGSRVLSLESRVPGFTLVEIVISLAILSVGLVGAMRVFPVGLRASQRAEMVSRATIAAQRTIESLKLKPWDNLTNGETTTETDDFTITTRISQPTIEGLIDKTRMKALEVAVEWQQNGRPRHVTLVTYARHETS